MYLATLVTCRGAYFLPLRFQINGCENEVSLTLYSDVTCASGTDIGNYTWNVGSVSGCYPVTIGGTTVSYEVCV